ncbi:glucose-1-phosphate thymidylyltransferase [Methanolinea mesophila]|uniref:sugar phosphate nucleotidyltransferase n=1 Tax=Methanolinea mesophila TaxID=547055 RepID=UPI001AE615A5|nr:sugar phosphate nucleotidyltransferase [Methanolinea mesophila]MBP1928639.1 glucose-1-phosphate thymidylyltransferase [Methanolinea mesophila]
MQAVILAAGEGKRVRPLTRNRPKALIPVANAPILDYPVHALLESGIRDIIVVVGYRQEHVLRHLNRMELPVKVVIQHKQLGTADALKCAAELINEDFLVLPGDNYIDGTSIRRVAGEVNAMLVKQHPYPSNFGVVSMQDGTITGITEKPEKTESFTISTGIASLTPDFLDYICTNDLTDAYNEMIRQGGTLRAVPADDWQDAVYPWDLLHMNRRLLETIPGSIAGTVGRDAVIGGLVRVEKGTTIGSHTVIQGPVIIGEECEIGPHCCIMPGTSIGDRVVVEPFTVVSNSILMKDVTTGSHSRIDGAVVGERSILGSHTTVLPSPTLLEIERALMKVNFGAVIGDQVTAGPFTVFEGAIVGNNVRINGNVRVRGLSAAVDSALVI